jgi:hypothetical protein
MSGVIAFQIDLVAQSTTDSMRNNNYLVDFSTTLLKHVLSASDEFKLSSFDLCQPSCSYQQAYSASNNVSLSEAMKVLPVSVHIVT